MALKSLQELNHEFIAESIAHKRAKAHKTTDPPATGESAQQWKPERQKGIAKPEIAPEGAPRERSVKRQPIWKDLLLLLVKLALIVLAFLMLFTFLFGIVQYQEPSMAPAIKDGDLILFYRHNSSGYLPQDVILFKYNGKWQIRRVVATAGDTVDITEGGLVVNRALQQEPEIFQITERYQEGVSFPLTVPEGQVFVLGDSRIGATDSRIYGCVKIGDTSGKVMTVIRRRGI